MIQMPDLQQCSGMPHSYLKDALDCGDTHLASPAEACHAPAGDSITSECFVPGFFLVSIPASVFGACVSVVDAYLAARPSDIAFDFRCDNPYRKIQVSQRFGPQCNSSACTGQPVCRRSSSPLVYRYWRSLSGKLERAPGNRSPLKRLFLIVSGCRPSPTPT
ncbi:hypothetical protein ARMGADRAFT_819079 [Armillaria gallica]|uniref:Uncharacterized protein n=1 Tax=Armillaria gallica TaxID=47427 RepID=A0A2H3CHU9_ARMGA|nr:hypothetical protein ARMGADRAFT_819079 [Armillaria gallica]